MASFAEILAQGQARERAANPDKMAWLDRYKAMPQGPSAVFNPVKPGDPLPYNPTGTVNPSNAAEMAAWENSPAGRARQAMYQEGVARGYIPKPNTGGVMGFISNKLIPGAIQGLTMAGIGGGLAGIAGVGPAAVGGGGSTAAGSGLNTAMGGMGGGAMNTAGGGLALTNSTLMPGSAAAAGGATGGIAAGGAFGSAIPGFTGAMNATGAGMAGNAAGVGVGGTGVGATAAGGAALNGASGNGWFNNFAQGAGTAAGALSGQNLLNLGVGAGIDALTADRLRNQANSAADKAAGLADPFSSQRPQYQAQLAQLMAHPESINDDPSYQFRLKSGQDALERSNAARGYLGSGNMNIDLQQYGQQSASQELNNSIGRLTQLSGGNAGPGYAGNVFGSLANTGLANSAQQMGSLGTLGGSLVRGLTGTGSTG